MDREKIARELLKIAKELMAVEKYELYYSTGGHGGPYKSLKEAEKRAKDLIKGDSSGKMKSVEIRPYSSKARGGYKERNEGSKYVKTARQLAKELVAADKYVFHNDPGHAWLEVEREELERLGILRKITRSSYQKGDKVFLEEDVDASTFVRAKKKIGETFSVKEVYKDPTPIRGYQSFRP